MGSEKSVNKVINCTIGTRGIIQFGDLEKGWRLLWVIIVLLEPRNDENTSICVLEEIAFPSIHCTDAYLYSFGVVNYVFIDVFRSVAAFITFATFCTLRVFTICECKTMTRRKKNDTKRNHCENKRRDEMRLIMLTKNNQHKIMCFYIFISNYWSFVIH